MLQWLLTKEVTAVINGVLPQGFVRHKPQGFVRHKPQDFVRHKPQGFVRHKQKHTFCTISNNDKGGNSKSQVFKFLFFSMDYERSTPQHVSRLSFSMLAHCVDGSIQTCCHPHNLSA